MLDIDRIQADVGSTIELKDVLLLGGGGDTRVGTPVVDGASVVAEVLEHGRDKKILVFKYKNKTRYRRRFGHRQDFTRLAIRQILADGQVIEAPEKPKPARKKRERKPRKAVEPAAEAVATPAAEAIEEPVAKPAPKRRAAQRKATAEARAGTAEQAPAEAEAPKPRRARAKPKAKAESPPDPEAAPEEKPEGE